MSLIDDARLTDKEIRATWDANAARSDVPATRLVSDAATAKALWVAVQLVGELAQAGFTLPGVLLALQGELNMAGIERPKEGI